VSNFEKRTAIYSVFVIVIVLFSVILLNNISGKSETAFNYPEIIKETNSYETKEISNSHTETKENPETTVENTKVIGDFSEEKTKEIKDFSDIEFNRILYIGMNGEDIKKAQYLLGKLGYYKGEINGYFDDSTKRAVILFQKDKEILPTGNIGDMTQTSLRQSTK
jgi:peptidoglycan hydrolase-like protein with peptidoglycan-binding domain